MLHDLLENSVEWSAEAGSEDRVDNNVVSAARLRQFFPIRETATLHKTQSRGAIAGGFEAGQAAHDFEISACVAFRIRYDSKQNDVSMDTSARKLQRESSAIATVVSRSAEYLRLLTRKIAREMRGYCLETGFRCRLHQ